MFAGLATLDVVHHVEAAPGADEKATSFRQDVAAGGPAAVAALAFAALTSGSGSRTALLTALGGPVGRLIGADLADGGVSVLDANAGDPDWMPAISSVRVSPDGRSITSPDASDAPALALPRFGPADRPDVVLVDGHHPDLALAVTAWAASSGLPVVVDLGRPKPVFDTVVPRSDVVVASAHHAGRIDELLAAGPAAVAVTAGAAPIAWGTADGRRGSVDVEPVEAVDTLGAGDVFHGAVAFRVARDGVSAVVQQFPAVLAWAARVSAVRVTTVGPHAWRSDPRLLGLAGA